MYFGLLYVRQSRDFTLPRTGHIWQNPWTRAIRKELTMEADTGQVTLLLRQLQDGRKDAAEQLVPLVYEELRQRAAAFMRHERSDHTLQATELVHEAYRRLVDNP